MPEWDELAYFTSACRVIHMIAKTARGGVAHSFAVSEEPQFGGCILVNLKFSFILIGRGTHSIAGATVNRLLADARVLPDVGNPSLETIKEPTLKDFYNNFESMLAAEGTVVVDGEAPVLPPIRPQCPVRAAYADYIIDMVLDLVVAHEMIHDCNGHRGYLAAVNRGDTPPPTDAQRRAMESDADGEAISQVGPANESRFQQFPPDHPLKNRSFLGRLHDLAFARTLMVLIEQEAFRTQRRFRHHPPVLVRSECDLHRLIAITERSPLPPEERQSAIRAGVLAAVKGYRAITGKTIDPPPGFQEVFESEEAELRRAWASIRPLLLPFACRPLLPADATGEGE